MVEHSIKIDIHDPRAAAIADVMANKTCKRILALLAERGELSESDIAQALGAPLNTVEYNMRKLVASGLVERTKKFFWSVKGKRIPTYRLSRKEIVISPRRFVSPQLLSLFFAGLIAIVIAFLFLSADRHVVTPINNDSLHYFASDEEFAQFIREHESTRSREGIYATDSSVGVSAPQMAESASGGSSESYSTTNVQVIGVDELDMIKNDGTYIYSVVGQQVVITQAYPADTMRLVATIPVNGSIQGIFVAEDKLVVVSSIYIPYRTFGDAVEKIVGSFAPCIGGCGGTSEIEILLYDIRDRTNVALIKEVRLAGNYLQARMTQGYVYVIGTESLGSNQNIPYATVGGEKRMIVAQDIAYVPGEQSYVFTSIAGLQLEGEKVVQKVFLTGAGSTIYVSPENMYLTSVKYVSEEFYYRRAAVDVIIPLLSGDARTRVEDLLRADDYFDYTDWDTTLRMTTTYSATLRGEEKAVFDARLQEGLSTLRAQLAKEQEKTVVHRISYNRDTIRYEAVGEVPGRVLNQFSLDEYKGNLRIATTTGYSWNGKSLNHLYVLGSEMILMGKVEDLAPGEQIYSVRFMGASAYIVTFRKIDPFYVIDLANPREPMVLGYLKIPGYSNYLHPYDETHVIGIGKDARGGNENFAYYQGLKISLFDVSDVGSPKEVAYLGIGDRGSDSPVLYDHKALLFDKERNLLVMPVLLAEVNESKFKEQEKYYYDSITAYGEPVWQGAYVLHVSEGNISVRGRVTHFNKPVNQSWEWQTNGRDRVERSLYIGETLYTISGGQIQGHDLTNLTLQGAVALPYPTYESRYGTTRAIE